MCTVSMQSDSCYEIDVSKELVKIDKQATMNYNRAHSSKFTSLLSHIVKHFPIILLTKSFKLNPYYNI